MNESQFVQTISMEQRHNAMQIDKKKGHMISIPQMDQMIKAWIEFKAKFDDLISFSLQPVKKGDLNDLDKARNEFNSTLLKKVEALQEYFLINNETFELDLNPEFRAQLIKLLNDSATLQIHFGMKDAGQYIEDHNYKGKGTESDPLKGKNQMSCVIMVGLDKNGDPIDETKLKVNK